MDSHILFASAGYEEAIAQVSRCLVGVGLQVVRSFDYQSSRATIGNSVCDCPYHGTRYCDCQVVVFLVYGADSMPATLLMHGRDQKAHFSLADTPQTPVSPQLEVLITSALAQVLVPKVTQNI